MVSIDFLTKSWTTVHGFDRFFEKIMDYSSWFSYNFFEKIMDYSSWFSLKKSWTIVHGFHQIFKEIMDYSPWFPSHVWSISIFS